MIQFYILTKIKQANYFFMRGLLLRMIVVKQKYLKTL